MKTSSSYLFKCPQYIRSILLALVWFSVGTICVFADPLTVTIDTPVEGSSFAGPVDVTIEATVSDSDGVVTGVRFYNLADACGHITLLGTVTAPPYRFTLNNLLSGSYSIYVDASDATDTTSSTVNFSVVGPIQSLVNAAAPGSAVDIPAGVYFDTVIINKNLTLRGAGARSTAIDGNNGCQSPTAYAFGHGTVTITGGATVTLSNLTVTRGGISNDSTLTLNDCAITGNDTFSGIYNLISGTVLMNNCTVSGNVVAEDGGGAYNAGTMILKGCTISGNLCGNDPQGGGGNGGGLLNVGTLSLNNCTVTGNTAPAYRYGGGVGGGILSSASGTVSCKSTITANNSGGSFQGIQGAPDFAGDLNSQGYNLIGNTTGAVILGTTTGNLLDIDPLLGPLQNNGGPTDTHALLPGSPALDAGISGGSNTDQRGVPRPIDIPSLPNAADGSDIGAYEFNASAPTVTITCPADIAADTVFGAYSAVVNYPAPLVSGGTDDLVVVCNPASGSVFPLGTTTVICTATDPSGNIIAACSFKVTVNNNDITCPADIAANNDPGQCSAVVNYPAPLVSGGPGDLFVVCYPSSGSSFRIGTTTVICDATDASSGNIIAACSFNVTINDTEPPNGSCAAVIPFQILQNPLRKVGRFQLLASDNCDPDPKIYIGDCRSSFVAGPFRDGDLVEIGAGPSLTPSQHAPESGPAVAVVFTKGDPLVWTVDTSGNASTPVKCK